MPKITNLVLEGGGVVAIAYAGFLKSAQANGLFRLEQLTQVAGVSSGAVAAMLIALNYSIDEIMYELYEADFKKFITATGINGELDIFTEHELYKNEYLYQYIADLIKMKAPEDITFEELHNEKSFKDIYVVATKLFLLNKQPAAVPVIFSHVHTPKATLLNAVRASTSIPLIFPPIRLLEENGEFNIHSSGNVYVDGGVINAYPISIFDGKTDGELSYNDQTLGIRLDSQVIHDTHTHDIKPIQTSFDYANSLFSILSQFIPKTVLNKNDLKRTVIINTLGITSTDFNISSDQKNALIKSGEEAALQLTETWGS